MGAGYTLVVRINKHNIIDITKSMLYLFIFTEFLSFLFLAFYYAGILKGTEAVLLMTTGMLF
jgi:hypothetical protein